MNQCLHCRASFEPSKYAPNRQRLCSLECRRAYDNRAARKHHTPSSRISTKYQRSNDVRQLESLLGRLRRDSEQYEILASVWPGLTLGIYADLEVQLEEAIDSVKQSKGFFAQDEISLDRKRETG